jgi:hypothetical protein
MLKTFHDFGFLKSYVYPAFWLFLLPAFCWWFYGHAASRYDNEFIEANVKRLEQLTDIPREQRAEAIKQLKTMYVSELLTSRDPADQALIKKLPDDVRIHYAFFRWMKWLALLCIISGICVFVFMGFSVYF